MFYVSNIVYKTVLTGINIKKKKEKHSLVETPRKMSKIPRFDLLAVIVQSNDLQSERFFQLRVGEVNGRSAPNLRSKAFSY